MSRSNMWGRKSDFKTSSCRVRDRLSVVRSTRLYEISFIRITFLSDVFSMSSLSHTAAHREWCVVGKRKKLYKLRSTASFLAVLDCGNITPTETQSLAKQSSFDSLEITMKFKIHKKLFFTSECFSISQRWCTNRAEKETSRWSLFQA